MNHKRIEMDKVYNPHTTEMRLYAWWESQGYFKPETCVAKGLARVDGPAWCITMPPPNVTGALHLGHAMTAAVEDLMTRYYRMKGYETLYLPGADHAGIATQNVVERELSKHGLTRHSLGREKFVEKVWEWKQIYHARITEQHKRLGISCDWDRDRFTLDQGLSRAVRTAFVRLYKKGLIYRGTYLVNWCPRCESAISDLEAIPEEHDDFLWTIRYPILNQDWDGPKYPWGSGRWAKGATEFIEMATARPETIMGDTAVATHEKHERFARLIGHTAVLPAIGRHLPIIADQAVDPDFGTGAVKITPAHDPTDYEIGLRHGLDAPTVLTDTGKMNEMAGPYVGLDRFEAREAVVRDFEKEGLLLKVVPYRPIVSGATRSSNPASAPNGSSMWNPLPRPLWRRCVGVKRSLFLSEKSDGSSTGWRTSGLGVSAVNCGGDTASRCGIATIAASKAAKWRTRCTALTVGVNRSIRTPMCWTPGSALACGRSAPWGGQMIHPTCVAFTRPTCARPAMTSSFSG